MIHGLSGAICWDFGRHLRYPPDYLAAVHSRIGALPCKHHLFPPMRPIESQLSTR